MEMMKTTFTQNEARALSHDEFVNYAQLGLIDGLTPMVGERIDMAECIANELTEEAQHEAEQQEEAARSLQADVDALEARNAKVLNITQEFRDVITTATRKLTADLCAAESER